MYLSHRIEEPLSSSSLNLVTGHIFLMLGDAGSGKETLGYLISKHFSLPFLTLGHILREVVKDGSHVSQTIATSLSSGKLVNNEVVAPLMHALTSRSDCRDGYVVNGYPRNLIEAHSLDALALEQRKKIQAISIAVPRDVSVARLVGKNLCDTCGKAVEPFIDSSHRNATCQLYCSACGSAFDDDVAKTSPDEIGRILRAYENDIRRVEHHYREKESLVAVNGVGSVEGVFSRMLDAVLGALETAAKTSPAQSELTG